MTELGELAAGLAAVRDELAQLRGETVRLREVLGILATQGAQLAAAAAALRAARLTSEAAALRAAINREPGDC